MSLVWTLVNSSTTNASLHPEPLDSTLGIEGIVVNQPGSNIADWMEDIMHSELQLCQSPVICHWCEQPVTVVAVCIGVRWQAKWGIGSVT